MGIETVKFQGVNRYQPRFGTKPAKTFPYDKYAELMTKVSVGGIKPDEVTVVSLSHQDVAPATLKIYKNLLEQGYNVSFAPVPMSTVQSIKESSVAQKANALQAELNQAYDHLLKLDDANSKGLGRLRRLFNPDFWKLQKLLSRQAGENETVKLQVATRDSDNLVDEIVKRVLASKGLPVLVGSTVKFGDVQRDSAIRDEQLTFVPPDRKWLYEHMSKLFSVSNVSADTLSKENPHKSPLPEAEQGRRKGLQRKVRGVLSRIYMDRMGRIEQGPLPEGKFFRTLGISPSPSMAKEFGMSLDEFGTFYKKITHMDKSDPVRHFTRMNALVGHYAEQLQRFHTFQVTRDDGRTDLTFSIRDKDAPESRYVAPSTITGNALPAEVFTSPVEDSVNGQVYLDLPFILDEKEFQGLTLHFEEGRVVDLDLEKGDKAHLEGMILGRGPKANLKVENFDRIGEFAIGFNRQITRLLEGKVARDTLIAEKQDLHFALGQSYTVTGGKNKCPLHVDIPATSGPGSGLTIKGWQDGTTPATQIYREGQFSDSFLNSHSDFDWKQYDDIQWD